MLSTCTSSPYNEPPPNPKDVAKPYVRPKNIGGSPQQAQAAQNQQKSAGWFNTGSFFEDSKKSITGAMGSGACGNDPELLGEWAQVVSGDPRRSRPPIKIIFTECEQSLSRQGSPCSGTYSYSTKGGVITGALLKKSGSCMADSTSTARYEIKGDTLTMQGSVGGSDKAFTYRRGASKMSGAPVNNTEIKTNTGSWLPPMFDFSWMKIGSW